MKKNQTWLYVAIAVVIVIGLLIYNQQKPAPVEECQLAAGQVITRIYGLTGSTDLCNRIG